MAFEAAGGKVTAMCEREPFCREVLHKYWPNVPIFGDVKTLRGEDIGAVDVIFGGFPCQPYSVSGAQKGKEDERHLWPHFARLVSEIRPSWVFAENVAGIMRIAADDVCADLDRLGYGIRIFMYEAAAVGAKHRRMRVFFVARKTEPENVLHAGHGERPRGAVERTVYGEHETEKTAVLGRPDSAFVSDTYGGRFTEQQQRQREEQTFSETERNGELKPRMGGVADGLPDWLDGYWRAEPDIPRTAKGIPNRAARLKAIGNAVVPAQIYLLMKAIIDSEPKCDP